jgi:hypothetical protein
MTDQSKYTIPVRRMVQLASSIGLILILSGCSLPLVLSGADGSVKVAQVVVMAQIPAPLAAGESLELAIVDEVTGLPYNQERHSMDQMADGNYGAVIVVRPGSMLTFVFHKVKPEGVRVQEAGMDGQPIRYRMHLVEEPEIFTETIAGWTDALPERGQAGYIAGTVLDNDLGRPLQDILVTAGGVQTVTDGSGSFTLFPVTPGEHTLVAYSMSGTYQPAQYPAVVAAGKPTVAAVEMNPNAFREVTFRLQAPEDTITGAPVRIAGNLSQLGNTFTDLGAGMSGDPRQMPVMTPEGGGLFTLTMTLPAGTDIRYKYTLGDGFWNAEHGLDQDFITHQLIIPAEGGSVQVEDQVASWQSSQTAPIWFEVTVPATTPEDEAIGIQFSVAEWMPALPMFKVRENTWAFPLLSPHNFSGEIPYRYCRNSPCTGIYQAGIEALDTSRSTTTQFSSTKLIKDTVIGWAFLMAETGETLSFGQLPQREDSFIAGVGLTPYYTPAWKSYFTSLVHNRFSSFNHLMMSPALQAANPGEPAIFQASLESTPRWQTLTEEIKTARAQGLSVSLYPQVLFSTTPLDWWASLPTSEEVTWKRWFEAYQQMVFQSADLGTQAGADTLVLGGDWLSPALPVGGNAEFYSQPGNIEALWQETITGVRERFSGQIAWMTTLETAADPPSFLYSVDVIYLFWDLPVLTPIEGEEPPPTISETLDEIVGPLAEELDKPVVIVLAIPSLQGYGQSCIPSPNDAGACIDVSALKQGPSIENPAASDIRFQAEYYHEFLTAAAERAWIDGVISTGYFPTLALHDASASIHGKPAEEIFESWLALVLRNE